MATLSAKPKIYHITHVDNLASIVDLGYIESDARRIKQGNEQISIGMTEIKRRRLYEIAVSCHPGTMAGEYVPFYFCPRSIMLYILHMGNHIDIAHYRGGQGPVVHLQMDLETVVSWADQHGVRWTFSDRNAGSFLADFHNSLNELSKIDWKAVRSTVFRDPVVKEGKQAEFLIYDACPWRLVEKIGVLDEQRRKQAAAILRKARHKPVVSKRQRGQAYTFHIILNFSNLSGSTLQYAIFENSNVSGDRYKRCGESVSWHQGCHLLRFREV